MPEADGSARWEAPWFAALALAIFAAPLALEIPLLDPDEGLHAAIAQGMVERGDYVVPTMLGEPFLDKPIFYFWLQAFSLRWLGFSEAAVRLPGLLCGLAGSVTTGLLAARLLQRAEPLTGSASFRIDWLAAIFHLTMVLPVALAQAAVHDEALVPWINLALLAFYEAAVCPSASRRFWTAIGLAGVALGGSFLTKGLVGIALVGLAFAAWLLHERRLSARLVAGGAAALGVAALVASPWYLLMEARSPGYVYYYFVERHLFGFATATQRHGNRAAWYYLPILLGGGLPWILQLPLSWPIWRAARLEGLARAAGLSFCWLWLAVDLAFLSAASSKLVTYILPLFPAVAILAADAWRRCELGELSPRLQRAYVWTVVVGCVICGGALPVALRTVRYLYDHVWPAPTVLLGAALALAGLAPIYFWRRLQPRATIVAASLALAASCLFLLSHVLAPLAGQLSARDLARHFNRAGRLPADCVLLDERIGSLVFYLDPALRKGLTTERLRAVTFDEFVHHDSPAEGAVVILPEHARPFAEKYLQLADVPCEPAGRHALYPAAEVWTNSLVQQRLAARQLR